MQTRILMNKKEGLGPTGIGSETLLGSGTANYKETILAILSKDPRTAAKELLGKEIVSNTSGGVKKLRIVKTRSFSGIGNRTRDAEGMTQQAGKVYIMRFRSGALFNLSTGKQGEPSCVQIEEALDAETGKVYRNKAILQHLEMLGRHLKYIFSNKTELMTGVPPQEVIELGKFNEKASVNTTGVFTAKFGDYSPKLKLVDAAK